MPVPEKSKSFESWIWDAACSIRGAKDAPKYKDYILPLISATSTTTAAPTSSNPSAPNASDSTTLKAGETDKTLRQILKQLGVAI